VTLFTGAKIRRLIPAGAVAAVIAFSWLTPAPSLASSTNNCGVKGYGYHDHGKPCPNRPFPGKGAGLAKFGINVATAPNGHIKHSVDTATSAGENVNLSLIPTTRRLLAMATVTAMSTVTGKATRAPNT
jgi:hypothetical protein